MQVFILGLGVISVFYFGLGGISVFIPMFYGQLQYHMYGHCCCLFRC